MSANSILSLKYRFCSLDWSTSLLNKIILRRKMSASLLMTTFKSFQVRRAYFLQTRSGAMCESLAFNSFAVCSQTPESLYSLFYFVFISSVKLLTVARIKKSIFKIQHATKPVCWYSKICKLSDAFSASSFLIAPSPPITRAVVRAVSSPHQRHWCHRAA